MRTQYAIIKEKYFYLHSRKKHVHAYTSLVIQDGETIYTKGWCKMFTLKTLELFKLVLEVITLLSNSLS